MLTKNDGGTKRSVSFVTAEQVVTVPNIYNAFSDTSNLFPMEYKYGYCSYDNNNACYCDHFLLTVVYTLNNKSQTVDMKIEHTPAIWE